MSDGRPLRWQRSLFLGCSATLFVAVSDGYEKAMKAYADLIKINPF